jgi:hypothetical protein
MKEIKTSYFVLMLIAAVVVGATGGAVYMNHKSTDRGYGLLNPEQTGISTVTPPTGSGKSLFKNESIKTNPTPSPALTPTPSPTPTPAPTPSIMSSGELWDKKDAYINKTVYVKDRANFRADCLSVEPPDSSTCATKVYIGPTPPETGSFLLYKDGKNIVCQGMPSSCGGYVKDQVYTIKGTIVRCGYADTQYCIEVK